MRSADLGYVCGALCGRGYIKRGRNNCVGLQTGNKQLAEVFASSMRALCTRDVVPQQRTRYNKIYFVINVYGKTVTKIFDDIGFVANKKSWSPPRLCTTNSEFRTNFLAGFFDSTSYVYFDREKFSYRGNGYRYLRVTSANAAGLDGIKKLLSMEGAPSSMRVSLHGPAYLIIGGDWRLKAFLERVPLRTDKKVALSGVVTGG